MSRIPTPASIEEAPEKAHALLNAVNAQLGVVPNMFRLISTSPQTLEAYLGVSGALGKGALPAATRERIALAIAEVNGCDYCLSAHTYLGKNLAKLDDAEITANRSGASNDPKADAAVLFAPQFASNPGAGPESPTRQVSAGGGDFPPGANRQGVKRRLPGSQGGSAGGDRGGQAAFPSGARQPGKPGALLRRRGLLGGGLGAERRRRIGPRECPDDGERGERAAPHRSPPAQRTRSIMR